MVNTVNVIPAKYQHANVVIVSIMLAFISKRCGDTVLAWLQILCLSNNINVKYPDTQRVFVW